MFTRKSAAIDMTLEVVVIPESDVDRAVGFYGGLGWRLDADIVNGDSRLVQFTRASESAAAALTSAK